MDAQLREETEALISLSLDGELTPDGEARLADILASNAAARALLDEWTVLDGDLTGLLRSPALTRRPARAHRRFGWLGRAAALLALAFGGYGLFRAGVARGRSDERATARGGAPVRAVAREDLRVVSYPGQSKDVLLNTREFGPIKVRNRRYRDVYRIPVPGRDFVLELEDQRHDPRLLVPVDY